MSLDHLIIYGVLPVFGLALVLSLGRLFKGPSVPDRVVALDMLTAMGIGIFAVYAILTDKRVVLDGVLILALISFVATIAFAIYIERKS